MPQGWRVNHKRINRLYRQEGLQVRRRRRKQIGRSRGGVLGDPAAHPNHTWSMDFVHDQMADGRRLRLLNIVDDFTRECLAVEVDSTLPGRRVVRVLDQPVPAKEFDAQNQCPDDT